MLFLNIYLFCHFAFRKVERENDYFSKNFPSAFFICPTLGNGFYMSVTPSWMLFLKTRSTGQDFGSFFVLFVIFIKMKKEACQ
jgi:hypothetical protein